MHGILCCYKEGKVESFLGKETQVGSIMLIEMNQTHNYILYSFPHVRFPNYKESKQNMYETRIWIYYKWEGNQEKKEVEMEECKRT